MCTTRILAVCLLFCIMTLAAVAAPPPTKYYKALAKFSIRLAWIYGVLLFLHFFPLPNESSTLIRQWEFIVCLGFLVSLGMSIHTYIFLARIYREREHTCILELRENDL